MSTITDFAAAAEDQIVGTIKQGQDVVLESLKQCNGTLQAFVPAGLVPDAINPADAVETAFGFAERLLSSQRQFVASVLEAVLPKAS